MGIEFLAFHDQSVAVFATDDQEHDFVSLDTIQHPQLAGPQFELS